MLAVLLGRPKKLGRVFWPKWLKDDVASQDAASKDAKKAAADAAKAMRARSGDDDAGDDDDVVNASVRVGRKRRAPTAAAAIAISDEDDEGGAAAPAGKRRKQVSTMTKDEEDGAPDDDDEEDDEEDDEPRKKAPRKKKSAAAAAAAPRKRAPATAKPAKAEKPFKVPKAAKGDVWMAKIEAHASDAERKAASLERNARIAVLLKQLAKVTIDAAAGMSISEQSTCHHKAMAYNSASRSVAAHATPLLSGEIWRS